MARSTLRYFHVTDEVTEVTKSEYDVLHNTHSTLGALIATDEVSTNKMLQQFDIKPILSVGEEEGEHCGQLQPDGSICFGVLESREPDGGCSCHCGNPPCGYCTAGRLYCEVCGWEEEDT